MNIYNVTKEKDRNIRQISPSGVVLETISPDGVVSKIIAAWGSSIANGEFGVSEQPATTSGDMTLNR